MEQRAKSKMCQLDKLQNVLILLYLFLLYSFGYNSETIIYSEIVLVTFMAIELLRIVISRDLKIKFNKVMCWWILFVSFCYCSSFWAVDASIAISKANTLLVLIIFFILIYNFYSRIDNGYELLLKNIMYAGTLFAVYVVMYYGPIKYFKEILAGERIGSEIDNLNSLGLRVAMASIISFYFGYISNKRYYALSIISFIVTVGAGSRTALALATVGYLLIPFTKGNGKGRIHIITKYILIALVIIIAFNLMGKLSFFAGVVERFETFLNYFNVNDSGAQQKVDSSTELRMKMIMLGLEQLKETPLSGLGIGNTFVITRKIWHGKDSYLHNNYVELLASVGIIGFILYYIVWAKIIKKLIKNFCKLENIQYRGEIIFSLIFVMVLLVVDFGAVSYYAKTTYIYVIYPLLLIDKMERMNEEEKVKTGDK